MVDLLMAVVFVSENIVNVKDVIAVLVIVPVVLRAFAWFGENPSGIS